MNQTKAVLVNATTSTHAYVNVTAVSSVNTPIPGIVASTSVRPIHTSKIRTHSPNSTDTMPTTIATKEPNVTSKPSITPSGMPNTSSGSLSTTMAPTSGTGKTTLPTKLQTNNSKVFFCNFYNYIFVVFFTDGNQTAATL